MGDSGEVQNSIMSYRAGDFISIHRWRGGRGVALLG